MPTVYQDRAQVDGSTSNKTFYANAIPAGKILQLESLHAYLYTDEIGDYTSAKYVAVGMDVNGLKHWLQCADIVVGAIAIAHNGTMFFKEGDRPVCLVEATAKTVTYVLVVNGLLYDKEEFEDKYGLG